MNVKDENSYKLISDKELLEIDNGFDIHLNPFVYSGYRIPCYDDFKCLKTITFLHNETVNIWSHLLGALLFIGILVNWFIKDYNTSPILERIAVIFYLTSVIFLLICSTSYHLSIGHSVEKANNCQCYDWFGVSFVIAGYAFFTSYFELYEYGFKNSFIIFNVFLISFMILSYQIVKESLHEIHGDLKINNKNEDKENEKDSIETNPHNSLYIRTFIMAFYSLAVLTSWLIHYFLEGMIMKPEMKKHLIGILLTYLAYLSVLFKVFFLPERLSPYTFDIFGYSHQIFHIGVVIGAFILWNTYRLDYV